MESREKSGGSEDGRTAYPLDEREHEKARNPCDTVIKDFTLTWVQIPERR